MEITENDLKFIHKMQPPFRFKNTNVENLYNTYRNLPLIEYRLYDAEKQDYYYLDLSCMDLNNEQLNELLNTHHDILEKITMIDLSENELTDFPYEILNYTNIKNIDISHNKITDIEIELYIENIDELDISNNLLTTVSINNCNHLFINNNKITEYNLTNIETLDCSYNNIEFIDYIVGLKQLTTCCKNISDMYEIEDIDVFNNLYCVKFK